MSPLNNNNDLIEKEKEVTNKPSSFTSDNVYVSPPSGTYSYEINSLATVDSSKEDSNVSDITKSVREFITTHENDTQVKQTISIIESIETILEGYGDLDLPEIHIVQGEDGSLGLSWGIDGALLGIVIDVDPKTSSYFLLIGKKDEAMRSFGNLYSDEIDLKSLMDSLVPLLRKMNSRRGKM